MNRRQGFEAHIERNSLQVVNQLLSDAEWNWLRGFSRLMA